MDLIRIENLHKTYFLGEIDVPVLKGVSFTIRRGEMVALMGASGSGKTTLMNILGCLDRPTSGEYWLDGQEMSRLTPNQRALVRTAKLGFVFQSFNLLPRTSALNNVLMPLDYAPDAPSHHAARERACELLERVSLSQRLDHEPSQMSGGQQQRVAIARSLINRPALLLADEPTGNLDSHTSVEILQMFQQLNAAGITVILVTHDADVAKYAHRTIRLVDGQLASDSDADSKAHGSESHGGQSHGSHPSDGSSGNGEKSWFGPPGNSNTGLALDDNALDDNALDDHGHASRVAAAHAAVTSAVATLSPAAPSPAAPVLSASPLAAEVVAPAAPFERQATAEKPHVSSAPPTPTLSAMLPPTLRTALRALRRNLMRSALTSLGIIIGVAAVIAIIEIGQGSRTAIQQKISTMGANTLIIYSGAATSGGVSSGAGSVVTLSPKDADQIKKQCMAAAAVSPVVQVRTQVVYGNRNCVPGYMYGTTPDYLVVRDWQELTEGEPFTARDVLNANRVCLIGKTVRQNLFQDESPIGRDIRVKNVALRVIGVLSSKGASMMGSDQDDIVIAPWTTIKYRVAGVSAGNVNQSAAAASSSSTSDQVNTLNNLYPSATPLFSSRSAMQLADTPQPVRFTSVDQIMVKAASAEEVSDAINEITSLLREQHHLRPEEESDFAIRDMAELTKIISGTSDTINGLLLIVALISLLVGGVGIMNIMLVSVTERTREIGLRMAVGARSHHVLRQFLIEAVVLCLFGGIIGVGLGRLVTILVHYFQHWPMAISIPAIIAAFAVSVTIGVVFGFYPAWKASRLDPIEALRYE